MLRSITASRLRFALGQRAALLGQTRKGVLVLGEPALARSLVATYPFREAQLRRRGDQPFVRGIDHPARIGEIVGRDQGPPLAIEYALDAPLFGALFLGCGIRVRALDDHAPAPDPVQDHRGVRAGVQADVIGHRCGRDQDVGGLAQQVVARVAELDRVRA
jgi:hypothetical protein